jgi:tetratricopeptide (TPR) repeat protein
MLMVRRISGRDLDEHALADIVTARCGRLPLAIALVAARLRGHPAWTGEYLLDLLADGDDDLEPLRAGDRSVRAAFQMSLDHLPVSRQLLFGLLGVVPGPTFDAYAVAALADTTVAAARSDLDACHEDHLLQETTPGRYRLHDLLRAYARSLAAELPADLTRDALRRLRDYYLHAARTAAALLPPRRTTSRARRPVTPLPTPIGPTVAAAQYWFDTELPMLVACLEQAAAEGASAWVADIADPLQPFLCLAGDRRLAAHIHRTALATAVAAGDRADEAMTGHDLGMILWLSGDHAAAADHAGRSHELCRAAGDVIGQANALTLLAQCRRFQGDLDAAADIVSQSVALHDGCDDPLGRARALTALGSIQRALGRYPEAEDSLRRGLELSDQLDDDFGRATTLCEIGTVQNDLGDCRGAIDSFTTMLELLTRLGARTGQATALSELGQLYSVVGDHTRAVTTLRRTCQICTDSGDVFGTANSLAYLGIAHSALGEYAAAKDVLRQADDLYTTMNFRHGQANVFVSLGVVQRREGDFATANDTLIRGRELYAEVDAHLGEAESLIELGQLALDYPPAGDPAEHFDQALTIARDVGSPSRQAAALRGKASVLLRRGDSAAARPFLLDARAIYQRSNAPEVADIDKILGTTPEQGLPVRNSTVS